MTGQLSGAGADHPGGAELPALADGERSATLPALADGERSATLPAQTGSPLGAMPPSRVDASAREVPPSAPDAAWEPDARSRAQQLHDVLAAVIGAAARCADAPSVAGNAPTLVVTVRAEDLAAGTGTAFLEDGTPTGLTTARHVGCAGAVLRVVMDGSGRVVEQGRQTGASRARSAAPSPSATAAA